MQHANARDREDKQINDFQQHQVASRAIRSVQQVLLGRQVGVAACCTALTLMLDPRYELLSDVYKLQ